MKVTFLCCVLLLAGTASCSPVETKSISLPDWFPDVVIPDNVLEWIKELINNPVDSIQSIIDKLPEIVEAIPGIIERIQEIVAVIIEKIPEIIPVILDKLPEIIAQIPAIADKIREVLEQIIEKIPELIPVILEKIPEIVAAIPEIVDRIKEILEGLDLPDWFPTLPDFDLPEWWPEGIPTLPEYNEPVPGTVAAIEEFPGIVQVEVGTGYLWVQGCVASVLTNVHVVSAARCFSGPTFAVHYRRILAGSSTRFTDGVNLYIQSVINHPSFTGNNFDADISVIRLAGSLTLGPNIQQTPIVSQGFNLPAGISVTLAGWGSSAQGGLISDRNLYKIDLVVSNKASCVATWERIPGGSFSIGDDKTCVAHPSTGGRNGDVRDIGAPIYYQGVLVAVSSFGNPVGNQQFPIVATNVGDYTNWIISNAN